MNKLKNEIDTEHLGKMLETAILINLPTISLKCDDDKIDDNYKQLLSIAFLNQISKVLGYDQKEKFDEIYAKALKLADDDESIGNLEKSKNTISSVFNESEDITKGLLESYDEV